MTQMQLERQIATATGESLSTVRQRGFSIADPDDLSGDSEVDDQLPQWIDWDKTPARY